MNQLYDHAAPKRATNLSVNRDLLAQAKAAGIPLSQTLEEALVQKLRQRRKTAWRAENSEAVAAYNRRIAEDGAFGDEFRQF